MRILIIFEPKSQISINVGEYMTVSQIYDYLPRILNADKKNYSAIYKDIILNDDKFIEFYNISDNDIIWIGKLENYLNKNNNKIIVELFLVRSIPDIMYLLMNTNETIGNIKLKLRKFITNIDRFEIICIDEIYLKDETSVESIYYDGKNRKLILNDKIDENSSFSKCCSIHDHYLIDEYFWDYHWNFWMILENISIPFHIRCNIESFKESINFNKFIDLIDYENLLEIPISMQNSNYLFITNVANDIIKCLRTTFGMIKEDYFIDNSFVFDYIKIALHYLLYLYVTEKKGTDKLIRDLIIEACDLLTEPDTNIPEILNLLLKSFLVDSDKIPTTLEEILNKWWTTYYYIPVKIRKSKYRIIVNIDQMKTVVEAKQITSMETNVPVNQLYLIKIGDDEQPNDLDLIDDNYFIEFVSSAENFKILQQIGKGGFGSVYLCEDEVSQKKFVLKKPISNDTDLYRDISIYSKMIYSNIINNYHGLFTYSGRICMAMEYLSGGSLAAHLIRNKHFSEDKIAKLSHQILIQLRDIHSRGIIHRDIKCDNVILNEDGDAKLIDFGVAKYIYNVSAEKVIIPMKAYKPGSMYYMAPELINGEPYNNKIDIWSFGVMVVEIITKNRPYPFMGPFQAAIRIAMEKTIEYEPLQPISIELKYFIDSCLTADPETRPSADNLIQSNYIQNNINFINL